MTGAVPTAAGIDGCRAGWVAALGFGDADFPVPRTELGLLSPSAAIAGFLTRLEARGAPATVAIDMPMGLPARAGLRECDRLARARLGPRRSSIFPAVDRELLGLDFTAARNVVLARRAAHPLPAGRNPVMTHQALNLAPKVAELDAVLRAAPGRQRWILEAHPELSFLTLAQSFGAAPANGLPSKRTAYGRELRAELLATVFPDAAERVAAVGWPRTRVATDDLLDAYAVLWTAIRAHRGDAETLGEERDAHGLLQRLVV